MEFIIIMGLILLVLVEYAIFAVAHEADEQAEEMYRKWKEQNYERSNNKIE